VIISVHSIQIKTSNPIQNLLTFAPEDIRHDCVIVKQPQSPKEGGAMELIKVSATSRSTAVAGAIAGVVREHGRAEMQAIGAGAVNQAVKAAAIARGYLLLDGINIILIPSFGEVDIDGSERTAVKFSIEPR
jgi:stage V sporulation protein S